MPRTKTDRAFVAALATVVGARIASAPRSLWELDEFHFVEALRRFEPLAHHPHPPGYPLLVGLGKVFAWVLGDPFASLVALSVLASIVTFVALALSFENLLGERPAALAGALLFSLSPAMLVHGSLPMSDPAALMFLALGLCLASIPIERWTGSAAILFGVFCSASIGCRPQYAIAVLPMFFAALWIFGRWRPAVAALASFTAVSLAWLVPLIVAVGGWSRWVAYEAGQASYIAQHDALLSRSGIPAVQVVARFVAHPWGPKWLSLPVIVLATAGLVAVLRARDRRYLPVAVLSAAQWAFCVGFMDPADGVRYALPAVLGTALLAARGLQAAGHWSRELAVQRFLPTMAVVAFGLASAAYAAPVLLPRRTSDSPPVQAARYALRRFPRGAIVLYEQALEPHAKFLLAKFHPLPASAGMDRYAAAAVPLFLYADGGSKTPGAVEFSWPPSDAYTKLTRNHYRRVSLIPIPPAHRYRAVRGVYAFERTVDGDAWRWLAPDAEVRLPPSAGQRIEFTLRLPPEAPIASNRVEVFANGLLLGTVEVQRGALAKAEFVLPVAAEITLQLRSGRSYTPSELGQGDSRHLAVQLVDLERLE